MGLQPVPKHDGAFLSYLRNNFQRLQDVVQNIKQDYVSKNGDTLTGNLTFNHPNEDMEVASTYIDPNTGRRYFVIDTDGTSKIHFYSGDDSNNPSQTWIYGTNRIRLVGPVAVDDHITGELQVTGLIKSDTHVQATNSLLGDRLQLNGDNFHVRGNSSWADIRRHSDGSVGTTRLVIFTSGSYPFDFYSGARIRGHFDVSGSKNAVIPDPEDEDKQFKFAATESNTPGFMEVDLGQITIPVNRRLTLRPEYLHKYSLIGRDPRVRMFSAGSREDAAPNAPYGWVEWDGDDPKIELRAPAGEYFVELRFIRNDPGVEGWKHYEDKPLEIEEEEEEVDA